MNPQAFNPNPFEQDVSDSSMAPSPGDRGQTDGSGQDVGKPIHFVDGQFAGQTIRAQLEEIQKADLGRKYARVDRRPLDPPPVVHLRLFQVHNAGTDRQSEKEMPNYDMVQTLGLVCTVDLFPVQIPDSPGSSSSRKDSKDSSSRKHSGSSTASNPSSYSSALSSHYSHGSSQQHSYTFVPGLPYDSPKSSVGVDSVQSTNAHTSSVVTGYPHSQPSTSSSHSDVIWKIGGHSITEGSKMTHALVGATFVQPANVDYQGHKALMFVFADLAVKVEGTFILRYRFFDIFSKSFGRRELAIQAECYGGTFRVYSTKEFPGLQASTELTKQLARWGVRLNIRETERKRRKKGDPRSSSPASATTASPTTRRLGPMDQRSDEQHGSEEDD